MFLEIVDAKYLEAYKIHLVFNNGYEDSVDLESQLWGEVYKPLKDINYFKNFEIKFNTIEWKNGADFAPEYLYELCKKS